MQSWTFSDLINYRHNYKVKQNTSIPGDGVIGSSWNYEGYTCHRRHQISKSSKLWEKKDERLAKLVRFLNYSVKLKSSLDSRV